MYIYIYICIYIYTHMTFDPAPAQCGAKHQAGWVFCAACKRHRASAGSYGGVVYYERGIPVWPKNLTRPPTPPPLCSVAQSTRQGGCSALHASARSRHPTPAPPPRCTTRLTDLRSPRGVGVFLWRLGTLHRPGLLATGVPR